MANWEVIYERAIRDDGSLFFPERLTHEFLDSARIHMGTQKFYNQYQNEVISGDDRPFKKDWLKYYKEIPRNHFNFCFIDPAISQSDSADYTAIVVVATDDQGQWFLRSAFRQRLTPPQIINKLFDVFTEFQCLNMGIETVAFQEALMYMAHEEMIRRNIFLPLTDIKPSTKKTKEMRILSLVPRFEWGRIEVGQGLYDFEAEYLDYAGSRSKHDDILDALASIDEIVSYPSVLKEEIKEVPPQDPNYERYYRMKLARGDYKKDYSEGED
jgi:predicted phage terminase large subunit-like protein